MKLITLIQSAINVGEAKGMLLNDILNSNLAITDSNADVVAVRIESDSPDGSDGMSLPGTIWLSIDTDVAPIVTMPDVSEPGLNPATQGLDTVERIPWGYSE